MHETSRPYTVSFTSYLTTSLGKENFFEINPLYGTLLYTICGIPTGIKRGVEQGGKSPFSLLSEPISPFSLLFEPLSPSSLKFNSFFSPASLLFSPISSSSQLCLGHFSLLPILFLPLYKCTVLSSLMLSIVPVVFPNLRIYGHICVSLTV